MLISSAWVSGLMDPFGSRRSLNGATTTLTLTAGMICYRCVRNRPLSAEATAQFHRPVRLDPAVKPLFVAQEAAYEKDAKWKLEINESVGDRFLIPNAFICGARRSGSACRAGPMR